MRLVGIVLCLGLLACAKGGGAPDSGIVPRDTGGRDTGRRDTGTRDAGPGDAAPACIDDEVGDTCPEATDLGTIDVGGSMVVMGKLPMLTDGDWYRVSFPPVNMPGMTFGGGMPSVTLEGDATMIFSVETECGSPASCGDGMPRELTSYSFVDDQSTGPDPIEMGEVANDFSTRDVEWPATLNIRVARRGGPVDCSDYTLTITR